VVIDLAEKWDFHHVVKLVKYHFGNDTNDDYGLSLERLVLAMNIKAKETAGESIKAWHASHWSGKSRKSSVPGKQGPFPPFHQCYLHETPVPELMKHVEISGARVFDLGSWSYLAYLELSPTTTWALLRARHLATTVQSEVDGEKFQAEFAKLLDIIMPVSTS
jgi:hypothetical protein